MFARAFLSLLFFCLAAAIAAGQPARQGWHAHYQGRRGEAAALSASAALALRAGETIHPELRERGFVAQYTGLVQLPVEGSYRFGLEAESGRASLRLNATDGGELARIESAATARTGWTRLPAGPLQVTVRFERAARGDGRLRTLWELAPGAGPGFTAEPIPSSAVRVPEALRPAVENSLVERRGRLLLQTKGCTNCHAPDRAEAASTGTRTAPRVSGIVDRLAPDWVRAWLLRPVRAGAAADMPDLFLDTPPERQAVEDLLHYLASLEGPGPMEPAEPAEPATDAAAGRRLFDSIGCVACHGTLESQAAPVRPLGDLKSKWNQSALAGFLRDPIRLHPDGRMPDFGLTEGESRALAAYLCGEGGERGAFEIDRERVENGRRQWTERRCGACHTLDAEPAGFPPARPLRKLRPGRGCLDPLDEATPRYDLSDTERGELTLGLESARRATGVRAPADRLARDLDRLACAACHAIDGRGGPPDELRPAFTTLDDRVDLGDEGRMPPDLSGVGFKLNPTWIRQVLEHGTRARPYMATRMPRFAKEQVADVPAALSAKEGLSWEAIEREPVASDLMAREGRKLTGPEGMSCITCHQFRDFPPAGTPGPDLSAFAERLRYEWWSAYIQNPSRFKPGTRMPSFGVGRASTVQGVLDGDLRLQADALWTYFNLGEFMPPPPGLEAPGALQIVVGERPEVFRTFLKDVGSRGIAVGLPAGIHFGFDAEHSRLVHAWRGPFLSAGSAWTGRGGQIATGQGPLIWQAPAGLPLVLGGRPESWPTATGREAGVRFRGYWLDPDGNPWFRYTQNDLLISENCAAQVLPEEKILRSFRLEGVPPRLELWLNGGDQQVALESPIGCRAERTDGPAGQTWFHLSAEPNATSLQFRLEILP